MSRLCLKHQDNTINRAVLPAVCAVCRLLHARSKLTEERDHLRYVLLHAEKPHAEACDRENCDCGYELALEGR